MKDTHESVRCRVEIYESSFANEPAASFETNPPLLPLHVGDCIDQRTWGEDGAACAQLAKGMRLRVKAVNETVLQVNGAPASHSLSVCVEVVSDRLEN